VHGAFSLKTVLMLAEQMLVRIKCLHAKHLIHRDIKPENFVVGRGQKANTVYMIDFGLAKKFRDPKDEQHIPYREGKQLVGTMRWISINAHLGIEQSRRDDLESLGYVLIHFFGNELPQSNCQGLNRRHQTNRKIMQQKMSVPIKELCKGSPACMEKYMMYCRVLMFEGRPDYAYLRSLFLHEFEQRCEEGQIVNDGKFDWDALANHDRQSSDHVVRPIATENPTRTTSVGPPAKDRMHGASSFGYLESVNEELESTNNEPGTATVPEDSAKAKLAEQRWGHRESGYMSSILRVISRGRLPSREPEAGRH